MIDYLIAGVATLLALVCCYALGDNILGKNSYVNPFIWSLLKLGIGFLMLLVIAGIAAAMVGIFITIHSNL